MSCKIYYSILALTNVYFVMFYVCFNLYDCQEWNEPIFLFIHMGRSLGCPRKYSAIFHLLHKSHHSHQSTVVSARVLTQINELGLSSWIIQQLHETNDPHSSWFEAADQSLNVDAI